MAVGGYLSSCPMCDYDILRTHALAERLFHIWHNPPMVMDGALIDILDLQTTIRNERCQFGENMMGIHSDSTNIRWAHHDNDMTARTRDTGTLEYDRRHVFEVAVDGPRLLRSRCKALDDRIYRWPTRIWWQWLRRGSLGESRPIRTDESTGEIAVFIDGRSQNIGEPGYCKHMCTRIVERRHIRGGEEGQVYSVIGHR